MSMKKILQLVNHAGGSMHKKERKTGREYQRRKDTWLNNTEEGQLESGLI